MFQASVVTQVVPRSPSRASPTARGPSGAAPGRAVAPGVPTPLLRVGEEWNCFCQNWWLVSFSLFVPLLLGQALPRQRPNSLGGIHPASSPWVPSLDG